MPMPQDVYEATFGPHDQPQPGMFSTGDWFYLLMINYRRTLPYAAVLLLLVVGSCTQLATNSDPRVGKSEPNLTLTTTDNSQIRLSDLKGKVVLLDFWATWCPPCQEALPHIAKLSNDPALAARGLKVIAIHSQLGFEKAKGYIEKNNLPLTVALDTDGNAEASFKVEGYPTTIIIGRDGVVQHIIEGVAKKQPDDELDTAVNKALAAK